MKKIDDLIHAALHMVTALDNKWDEHHEKYARDQLEKAACAVHADRNQKYTVHSERDGKWTQLEHNGRTSWGDRHARTLARQLTEEGATAVEVRKA